jgi:hypothetical protein
MGIIGTVDGTLANIALPPGNGLALGNFRRKIIQFNIPNRGLVEMYINPQSLVIQDRKIIKETRTKNGYMIQYWGEQLPEIDITGITGSSGIEGINVLFSIYRQEQIGFSDILNSVNNGFLNNVFNSFTSAVTNLSVAGLANNPASLASASLTTGIDQSTLQSVAAGAGTINNSSQFLNTVSSLAGNVANVVDSAINSISGMGGSPQLIPTLAALALSVELWYDGIIYRGYFKDFRVTERAEQTGIFEYAIKFMVTRRSGIRHNSFGWQRSADFGPADSNVIPLSFGAVPATGASVPPPIGTQPQTIGSGISRRSQVTGGG